MKRVGLLIIFVLFLTSKFLAYPQPLGRIDSSQTSSMEFSALGIMGGKLYLADEVKNEILIYDIDEELWQTTGIKISSKSVIQDIYVDEGQIHLFDSKKKAIFSYDFQGKLVNRITTKGVRDLHLKKPSRLLVNYQSCFYIMDSRKLYALTKEGMLTATADLENPVSMSLGKDQLIRVLQHTKKGSQLSIYDLNLVRISRTDIPNPSGKANYIIDMAVNRWGELHVINGYPVNIDKLGTDAKQMPGSFFGSLNKRKAIGNFQKPSLIKSGYADGASIIAIYDSKQRAIHLFKDTEHNANQLLVCPTYTIRHELKKSKLPLSQDFLPTEHSIYMICDVLMPDSKHKAKPRPAVVCRDREGNDRFAIYLQQQKKEIRSFSALALSDDRLFVLDNKANMVHIYGADDGIYIDSFGEKGFQEGYLNDPGSIAAGADELIYVADTKNRRISVFNKQGIYIKKIVLGKDRKKPVLLRSYGQDIFCLTGDSCIFKIPINESGKAQQHISAKSISSFDLLSSDKVAYIDNKTQKLMIYNGKVKEREFFAKSNKAYFPHFKSIYLIRYDEVNQQLVIMDRAAEGTRLLRFYAALDKSQIINMCLSESLQTVLSWKALPGISNWIVQATDADGSTEHNVSEPRYLVIDPMDSVISYTVCPVAADGKRGIVSDTVEDYFSYARHLHVQGQYVQAVEALRSAKGSILDPKIDLEIVKNYVCQAQVHEDAENHTLALDYLRQAASIRGTSTEIALKAVHIYKISKDYLRGIKYLEGVNYEEDQSLISEYITLQYLNEAFATVIDKANLYVQKYGSDVIVLRYLATAHEEMEEFSHALSGFQRLASIEPSFENDLKIGELQIKTGRLKAAELHLQQMLTRYSHEKLDLVYFLLGECGMLSENYGIAIDHYLSAIRLDNSIAKYHYGLGAAYMQNNKPGESLNSFKKAYELSPTNAHYSFAYGRALKRQGDIESALSVLESAQDYVARNATAVEHHLLYANLLSSMSRYEDALREISVARSYQPDDPEIENRYLTAKAALQTQNLTREVIEFRSVQLNRIFPSLNKYYETNPIGQITLYNTSNTTITDLEISVFIHEVSSRMNTILVPTLIAKQEEVVPIPASFNDRLFDRPRIVPVDINLKFVHEGTQHNPSLRNQTVEILSNKAMDWQKRRSIASFVNPQDNNLSYFVKQNIVQTFRNEQSTILNRNLILALQAYSFYRANGVTFSSDSSISNLDTSQLDEVQFPFQLLETKAGDCEDLLVLMAGTLESIGTQTALIDIPGHVMLAVKVDMSAAEITKNGLNPDYFIERHATHWLPLETTLIGKDDFVTSWLTAIRHYKQKVESGLMPEIIEFADAQKLYPPSSFTKAINNKAYQNISDAKSLYQKDLAKILKMTEINQEMDFRAALERYPQNVSVKFQYAIWCVKMNYFDKAERLLLEIQTQDPRHFNAILNLGNIYAKTSRYELARKQYLFALEKTTTQKDQVYRNLCLLEYRDMNRAKAMEYFLLLSDKDIIKQVDMQIYADLMEQGE